jgi:hypothetical protein
LEDAGRDPSTFTFTIFGAQVPKHGDDRTSPGSRMLTGSCSESSRTLPKQVLEDLEAAAAFVKHPVRVLFLSSEVVPVV